MVLIFSPRKSDEKEEQFDSVVIKGVEIAYKPGAISPLLRVVLREEDVIVFILAKRSGIRHYRKNTSYKSR